MPGEFWASPTDRGKIDVKRHILTDGYGVPISVTVSAANVHDSKMLEDIVDAVPLRGGRGGRRPINICLDKAYDSRRVEARQKVKRMRSRLKRVRFQIGPRYTSGPRGEFYRFEKESPS